MQLHHLLASLFSVAVVVAGSSGSTPAQTKPGETAPGTPATSELIIDQIKRAVVFLQGTYQITQSQVVNGVPTPVSQIQSLVGTGFFIWVPDPQLGEKIGITYLVTNKHLLREPNATGLLGAGPYFTNILMRVNTTKPKADGTQYELVPISVMDASGSLSWIIDPDDDTVDLALAPIALNYDLVDMKTIQSDLFATKVVLQREHVNENDEILFAGLFAWNPGAKKNYPIVRHGKLARLSEERIPLDRANPTKTVEVHLADVMSFGGNSGSPVFLRLGGVREGAGGTLAVGYSYYLLGVMQGFFPEGVDFAIDVAQVKGQAAQNSGIAAVVPSDKILKLLDSPRGRAYRERIAAQAHASKGDFSDAEQSYRKAIEILQAASPEHSDLAVTLEGYASFLRDRGRPSEAKPLEERARKVRSSTNIDRMHPKI